MEISYKNSRGLWRRVANKTEKALFNAIDNLIKNKVPSCRKSGKNYDYIMIVVSEDMYNGMKKLPQAIKKGRWLYIKYRRRIVFVRYIKINKPKGFNEVKISRNCSFNPIEIRPTTAVSNKAFEIQWKEFEFEPKKGE